MCIAIAKPKGVKIPKRVLKACFLNNPDGAGFAYPEDGKVKITKGLFSFRSFWREYREINPEDKSVLIHFRVATSGKIDSFNCHPWRINETHAFIHNGNLASRLGVTSETVSDTGIFAGKVLTPIFNLSSELWKSDGFLWMMEEAIGSGNKLAIINSDGEFQIFNSILGEREHGAWFSNKTYKEERKSRKKATAPAQSTTTSSTFTSSAHTLPAKPVNPANSSLTSKPRLLDYSRPSATPKTEENLPVLVDLGELF